MTKQISRLDNIIGCDLLIYDLSVFDVTGNDALPVSNENNNRPPSQYKARKARRLVTKPARLLDDNDCRDSLSRWSLHTERSLPLLRMVNGWRLRELAAVSGSL